MGTWFKLGKQMSTVRVSCSCKLLFIITGQAVITDYICLWSINPTPTRTCLSSALAAQS